MLTEELPGLPIERMAVQIVDTLDQARNPNSAGDSSKCVTADHRQPEPSDSSRQPLRDSTNGQGRASRSEQPPRRTGLTSRFTEDEIFEVVW